MWQVGQKSSEEGADADTCTLSELLSAPAPGAGAHLQGITCFFASSDRGGRTDLRQAGCLAGICFACTPGVAFTALIQNAAAPVLLCAP